MLNNIGVLHSKGSDQQRSRQLLERKLDVAGRLGSPWALAVALDDLGEHCYERGDLAGWRSFREEALLVARRTGLVAVSYELAVPGEILLVEGKSAEARAHFERCVDDGRRPGAGPLSDVALSWLAELDRLEGKLAQARGRLEAFLQKPDVDLEMCYPRLVPLMLTLLEMRSDEADRAARGLLEEVGSTGLSQYSIVSLARINIASGWLAARDGNRMEAMRFLDESLDTLRSRQFIVGEGEVLVHYGLILDELGETVAASERFAAAAELFRRIGHIPHARRAELFLARASI